VTPLCLCQSVIGLCEVWYMTPFVLWCDAIAVADLSRQVRLDLLRIAFPGLLKWASIRIPCSSELLSQLQVFGNPCSRLKFGGAVENLFGFIRLACHDDHSWDGVRGAVAKGSLSKIRASK
jgi:hypothetical protein